MVETTRIFLPLVLKSKGRIVNITSIMGRLAAVTAPYVRVRVAQSLVFRVLFVDQCSGYTFDIVKLFLHLHQ
jgi:NAD(P)-dependent dehydrogenase (short-subunit alcohol dehydrogenase family)